MIYAYMLSIDDACLCYRSRCMQCFRSMMHVTHIIDQWCIVMLTMMMHLTCNRWCMLYLSIDEAYSCCWSMIHAIHAIDRWRLHMLSIYAIDRWCIIYDDACYTCYRSMMHATCYQSLMMHAYAVDLRYTLHAIDRWCIVYMISMMMHTIHAYDAYYSCLWWYILCYRSLMNHITHVVDLWYICGRSMMMHHMDLRCMLHMLLIDNVYTRATIDDAWYVCYRSMMHILAINLEAHYILQQS